VIPAEGAAVDVTMRNKALRIILLAVEEKSANPDCRASLEMLIDQYGRNAGITAKMTAGLLDMTLRQLAAPP
jgi:hypothetical protein